MYNYDVDLLMMSTVNARNMQRSLINVLYVNKQEFSASIWKSNQGCIYIIWQYFLLCDIFVNCNWVVNLWQQYSTHLHTNNTQNDTNNNRTTQITTNVEKCGPCPIFGSFTLAFALQLRKNHGKVSVRLRKTSEYSIHITKTTTHQKTIVMVVVSL